MQNLFEKVLGEALETIGQYDNIEGLIQEFYSEEPVEITSDMAKALMIFKATIGERHEDKNPILLFSLLREQHYFEGVLKPLNELSVEDFVDIVFKGIEIIDLDSDEDDEDLFDFEDDEVFSKGDYVYLLGERTYAVVEEDSCDGETEVWLEDGIAVVKNCKLRKVTDKLEKQIANILINWSVGSTVYCYDESGNTSAKFMIITGDEVGEYKLLNLENHQVIDNSNTSSKFNVAYFIVKNTNPAMVEVI